MQVTTSITLTVLHDGQFLDRHIRACGRRPLRRMPRRVRRRRTHRCRAGSVYRAAMDDACIRYGGRSVCDSGCRALPCEPEASSARGAQARGASRRRHESPAGHEHQLRGAQNRIQSLGPRGSPSASERRFALRRQKRKAEASRKVEARNPHSPLDALRGVPLPALRRERVMRRDARWRSFCVLTRIYQGKYLSCTVYSKQTPQEGAAKRRMTCSHPRHCFSPTGEFARMCNVSKELLIHYDKVGFVEAEGNRQERLPLLFAQAAVTLWTPFGSSSIRACP